MDNADSTISPEAARAALNEALNGSGESPVALPPPSAATLAAGQSALEQSLGDGPKRKRGRPATHGKYARKENQLPVAKMGNGTAGLLLENESAAVAVPIGTEEIQKPFDEEVARNSAGLVVDGVQLLNNIVKRWKIERRTGNGELADFVIEKKKIGEKPRASLEKGLVLLAKKHGVDMAQSPEGLIIFGLLSWQAEDALHTRQVIAEYLKMRPEEKPAV